MKKNTQKICLTFLSIILLCQLNFAFAQTTPTTPSSAVSNPTSAQLFHPITTTATTQVIAVQQVAGNKTWQQDIASIIKIFLNIAGALALLGFTLGGVLMIVGTQGKEDLLKKGKDLVKATLFGLIVIAISYALVLGVSELQFFSPGAGGTAGTNSNSQSTQQTTQSGTGGQGVTIPGA